MEDLARSWCSEYAAPETLGGLPSRCEPALIACREHKTNHELDVVAVADPPGEKSRILAIGEVKAASWPAGINQLERLRHIRSLLPADSITNVPRLLLFSRRGFTSGLTAEAGSRSDVDLIDLHRLYHVREGKIGSRLTLTPRAVPPGRTAARWCRWPAGWRAG